MGSRRKRPRANSSKIHAECPFIATTVVPFCKELHPVSKKRKRNHRDNGRIVFVQKSPFNPNGKFKTCQTLDTSYSVKPYKRWSNMTRYNNFVLNNVKYSSNDFVYVANDKSIKLQQADGKHAGQQCELRLSDCWVAKILEIRASDENHVYARVYWMYFPDDLPLNTLDNETRISGRQSYHTQKELIASNHMDIINVVSVAMRAVVHHWVESDDYRTPDVLHWRQALDCRTLQLSSVEMTCNFGGSHKSNASQVNPANTEQQMDALPSPAPSNGEDELRMIQSEHCDLVPAKLVDDNLPMTAGPGPFPPTGDTTGLLGNGAYPIVAEGDSHEKFAKICPQYTVFQTGKPGTGVFDIGSMSRRNCIVSPIDTSTVEMRPTVGDLTNTLPIRQSTAFPSVPSVYLPSRTQHLLLMHLQHTLELACYDFGKRTMPDILHRRGWDCAESVELNRWTGELLKRQENFSHTENTQQSLDELFCSIASIWHSAVHRYRVSTKIMEQFLLHAETLTILLGDAERRSEIAMLRQEIQAILKELEHNEQALHSRLNELLGGLAAHSVEFRNTEAVTITEMRRQDKKYKVLAGKGVEAAIASAQQKVRKHRS